jgi:hypothetical protein
MKPKLRSHQEILTVSQSLNIQKKLLKSVSSPLAIGCSHVIHANLQGISVGV